ncbi:Tripartite-type tricarboxylate transporter receptor subunit TctC [Bordetella sputigena]
MSISARAWARVVYVATRRAAMFLGTVLLVLPSVPATAAAWPSKPIRMVVAYPPGGGTDIVARLLARDLSDRLGVAVVVENRGGAAGAVGAAYVAHAEADGNTLLFGANAELTIAPATNRSLPYDPLRDLIPITQIAGGPNILVASNGFAPNTLAELIQYAKAHPGVVNYSTGGNYGTTHMATLQFEHRVGIDALAIPYRGSGPALQAVVANQVSFSFNTPGATLDLIKGKTLKAIAVASDHRLGALPDVPTISESGYPGFTVGSWYGLLAPAGTPADIVQRLHDETFRFLQLPETREALHRLYIDPIGSDSADFGAFMKEEIARYRALMASLNLQPQ